MPPTSKRSGASEPRRPAVSRTAGPGTNAGIFRDIYAVVARVPRGRIVTYGQVARMAGFPGAARTVGWAMASLPAGGRVSGRPVPWHRVLNAQGGISPRPSETAGRPDGQAARLRREGVRPEKSGRFSLERYGWDGAASGRARSGRSG
jgi:methylated-DNA-protein-cysteine methyltransferase related protein